MKVRITVTEKTTYTDVVEMSAAEFRRLQNNLDEESGFPKGASEEVAGKIHRSNETWLDADLEGVEIEKEPKS